MSRAAVSPDVRWCRSSPSGWGLLHRAGAHNIPVQAASDPPASPLEQACLRVGKLPCVSILSLTSGYYSLRHRARLRIPDVGCVLGDGATAGELPGTGDIQDCLVRPPLRVGVQFDQPLVRLEIGPEVRKVHVVIPVCQQCVEQGSEDTGFLVAKVV